MPDILQVLLFNFDTIDIVVVLARGHKVEVIRGFIAPAFASLVELVLTMLSAQSFPSLLSLEARLDKFTQLIRRNLVSILISHACKDGVFKLCEKLTADAVRQTLAVAARAITNVARWPVRHFRHLAQRIVQSQLC